MAERWHARLGRVLEHQLRGRQPLVLSASHPDFEQTNAIGGDLSEGTANEIGTMLEGVAQPTIGVGASQFGAAIGGGIGLQFGGMLGDQTFRVNLLGFAMGHFDFSKSFQRPWRGWIFQFNLSAGW